MFIACVVVTAVLAVASFGSAMGKIQGIAQMTDLLGSVGVSASTGRILGFVQLAGAAGIILGLFVAPIGIAAAGGLTLYYLGAMAAHARAKHPLKQVFFPFPLVALSLAALVLRIITI
jgi:hypothetical protein